jgi:hypothetical protein
MTKNRAHKKAARQRAAVTGERYVVAERAVGQHPIAELAAARGRSTSRAHDLMHELPGVPPHVDGGLQHATRPARTAAPSNPHQGRTNRQYHEPRVLVSWQNWIARRLGVSGR